MNSKSIIMTILITLIGGLILFISNMSDQILVRANTKYQVYLRGEKIGLIDDDTALYDLIDASQTSIKDEYDVENVYPPTDLKLVEVNTYDTTSDDIHEVYDKIEEVDDFTLRGYVITVKGEEEEYTINVLDQEVFSNAAKRVVNAFLEEDDNRTRGEFVLVVGPAPAKENEEVDEKVVKALKSLIETSPVKAVCASLSELTGINRNRLYDIALKLKSNS